MKPYYDGWLSRGKTAMTPSIPIDLQPDPIVNAKTVLPMLGYLRDAGYQPWEPAEDSVYDWLVMRHPTLKWEVWMMPYTGGPDRGVVVVIQGPDRFVHANTLDGDFDWIVENLP